MEFRKAKKENLEQVYELVQETIREVYPKYYLKEIVDMFCEFHNKERIAQDVEAGTVYILFAEANRIGTGTINENHITAVSGQGIRNFYHEPSGRVDSRKL